MAAGEAGGAEDGELHGGLLEEVARAAIEFYRDGFPMAASLFSEPRLLAAHREALRARGAGPQHVGRVLAEYLRAEQARGGVRAEADPDAAASLLLGACLQQAFLSHFADRQDDEEARGRFAAALVGTLVGGLGWRGRHPTYGSDGR